MATAIPHTGAACLHRISFEYVSFHVTPCHISPADVMSYQTVHVAKAIVIPYRPFHIIRVNTMLFHTMLSAFVIPVAIVPPSASAGDQQAR